MSKPTPHIITPAERGHRAPLSDEGPSITYPLRVPKSWHGALKRAGADAVRKRLKPLVSKFTAAE
jgi:hypothetical protein